MHSRLIGLFGLAMLIASQAPGLNLPGGPDDHFLCYKAKVTPQTPKFLTTTLRLTDDFEDKDFDVKKLKWICNPAEKNFEPVVDDDTHLAAYKIKAAKDEPKHVPVVTNPGVFNQFGLIALTTVKEDLLLVPSSKDPTNPPPPPGPNDVDHFKCYKAKVTRQTPKFIGTTVSIGDQFTATDAPGDGRKLLSVKKPKHLCLPVDKNGEGIKNSQGLLTCYKAKPAADEPAHIARSGVKINNQLGGLSIDTKKEAELCVPSIFQPLLAARFTDDLPSPAEPPHTPGSTGVVVTNPKLITQFGGTGFTLNQTRYTRHGWDVGGAVRDNVPRCVDGATPCTIANEAVDCLGQLPPKCTPPTAAYSIFLGLLNPRIFAAVEPSAIQGITDRDSGQVIIQVDQGSPGNNALDVVPDLAPLNGFPVNLPPATVEGAIGTFVDDDGLVAGFASFVATSVGAVGPSIGPLRSWLDSTEGPFGPSTVPVNGPKPTTLPAGRWGQEKEVTYFPRLLTTFYDGGTNFVDWYYPSSGLSTTSVSGDCPAGVCTTGNVGASCSSGTDCGQAINLDSTALSIGRGRRDIENLTQAAGIDIPVIGLGGSNGLTPIGASYLAFAQSIGPCTAPSCDGTPRVVSTTLPNPAFPTFGDGAGGYEVHISEGFAHVDVLTAEDDANNNVISPLAAFLRRNLQ